ncbi:MAG TPA: VCBS repeat-containing protein, partial [Acidimicrobiales bacterium]|nr:VCBS repeat-containing protein [Acidimicrobiales bacterium]
FAVASPATGAAGTACAGTSFAVSAPDAAGVVTLTPSAPVVLGPPGGPAGSDRCTVNFTFSTLRVPAVDVDPSAPGAQTRFSARVVSTSTSGLTVANHPSAVTTVVPPPWKRPPADFDGDRDTDVSVYRPSTGQWFIAGGNPAVVTWGAQGDVPVPADYTGDGRADPAVYRPSTGQWFIAGANPGVVSWGAPGDVPAPGDYTGDARDDVAVYRPSTGQWFVAGSPGLVTWGAQGDVPVPGDYTGDGRTDMAVYRPTTGQWFILGGNPALVTWGAPGDVPLPLPAAIRQAYF